MLNRVSDNKQYDNSFQGGGHFHAIQLGALLPLTEQLSQKPVRRETSRKRTAIRDTFFDAPK